MLPAWSWWMPHLSAILDQLLIDSLLDAPAFAWRFAGDGNAETRPDPPQANQLPEYMTFSLTDTFLRRFTEGLRL